MNLRAIANQATSAINPNISAVLRVSTGSTRAGDYTQVPTYATDVTVTVQNQALTGRDIEHLDSLNIQGVVRKVYLNGNVEGLNRAAGKGGDLLVFGGRTWLVVVVFERWDASGWSAVGVTEQN